MYVLMFPPGHSSVDLELSLQLLLTALCVDVPEPAASPHWVLDCSPFPLLYVLAQLQNQTLRLTTPNNPPLSTLIAFKPHGFQIHVFI